MSRPEQDDYRFQVDLSGLLDLVGRHLYASPRVFLRELLQNGVDAIIARRQLENDFVGGVRIEWIESY